MGWFGDLKAVLHYLSVVGADKDQEGNFLLAGENITVGMGGQEVVVPCGTVYFVEGKEKNLAAGLGSISQGIKVKVF